MPLNENLSKYLAEVKTEFKAVLGALGGYISFSNSGIRGGVKTFQASLDSFICSIEDIIENYSEFESLGEYNETNWRLVGGKYFRDDVIKSLITVQTKPVFATFSKLIGWGSNTQPKAVEDGFFDISEVNLKKALNKLKKLENFYSSRNSFSKITFENLSQHLTPLPKPFLLLAGISGTGKSRFVKEQARLSDTSLNNFCMLSVRPDWHEPSDLLGYVSRIPQPHYVVSEFLLFVIKAWKNAFETANSETIFCKPPAFITPYWLCLDEMNLAPVEQYFADYLSVLETRQWDGHNYSCDPLLKASAFNTLDTESLKESLGLTDPSFSGLWDYFKTVGIPISPNLIVAGTVNMDETTHGFSRKVIDRALTIDFGAFFPNQLEDYFKSSTTPIPLSFPVLSRVNKADLAEVVADSNGEKSIAFLKSINGILSGTPFELAYRALNELLISVVCFNPKNELELHAVWDDFLMTKVLPRLDGDSQKLKQETTANNLDNLLTKLKVFVEAQFNTTIQAKRPDLLRLNKVANAAVDEGVQGAENGSERIEIDWRSVSKLTWMNSRLQSNGFTSYWP